MPNVPTKKVNTTARISWTIGQEDRPTDAKDFRFGLQYIYAEMQKLGVDRGLDDAFFVKAGDGGEIIVYVDRKVKS
jgi:hypothetical protein